MLVAAGRWTGTLGLVTGSSPLVELFEVLQEKCSLCGTKGKYCQEQNSLQERLLRTDTGNKTGDEEKTSPQFTGVGARLLT